MGILPAHIARLQRRKNSLAIAVLACVGMLAPVHYSLVGGVPDAVFVMSIVGWLTALVWSFVR